MEGIAGKRALITGASSGIGEAIARTFAHSGAVVGIHYYRSKALIRAIQSDIRSAGGAAEVFRADLLRSGSRSALVRDFVSACGGIDILVNNAGAMFEYKHFSNITEREWERMFVLHAEAPFFLAQAAFSSMRERGWGRIVNISSNAVKYAGSHLLHYAAAKAALDVCTTGFAREGARYGVLVNSIRCGKIDTRMHTKYPGYDAKRLSERVSLIPLRRMGTPEEVARMALFLVSKGGDFITGQHIAVAGGE
jgi:3-oxoacyl-[acyl-carrier protein] reductase